LTDNALAPTRGGRAMGRVTPYEKALSRGAGMVESKGPIFTCYALVEDASYIPAGRIAACGGAGRRPCRKMGEARQSRAPDASTNRATVDVNPTGEFESSFLKPPLFSRMENIEQ
jgi:hypothetical protein